MPGLKQPQPSGSDGMILPEEFLRRINALEAAYLIHTDPILQSGFGGGEERWKSEREPILEAVSLDGDFLDIGCANGYLLECLIKWSLERGITLSPYGLDIGPRLIELARKRFPQFKDHFFVGNAWNWIPPRKFKYVYTLDDCIPEKILEEYIKRLLHFVVEQGGTLIVGAYGSVSENRPASNLAEFLDDMGFPISGSVSAGELPTARFAWIKT